MFLRRAREVQVNATRLPDAPVTPRVLAEVVLHGLDVVIGHGLDAFTCFASSTAELVDDVVEHSHYYLAVERCGSRMLGSPARVLEPAHFYEHAVSGISAYSERLLRSGAAFAA